MALFYNATLICVSGNDVGAHFDHNPFLGPIPHNIYTEPVSLQAAGVPVECQNSTAVYSIRMQVIEIRQGTAPWVMDFFGHVI